MLAIHLTPRRANSRSPLQTSMARLLKIGIRLTISAAIYSISITSLSGDTAAVISSSHFSRLRATVGANPCGRPLEPLWSLSCNQQSRFWDSLPRRKVSRILISAMSDWNVWTLGRSHQGGGGFQGLTQPFRCINRHIAGDTNAIAQIA